MNFFKLQLILSSLSSCSAFLAPTVPKATFAPPHTRTPTRQSRSKLNMIPMTQSPPALGSALSFMEHLIPQSLLLEATSPLPSTLTATLTTVQMAGEATFASAVVIAALQGALIMHQYANNPQGELIVPPGLTIGIEDATTTTTAATPTSAVNPYARKAAMASSSTALKMFEADLSSFSSDDGRITKACEASSSMKSMWYNVNRFLAFLFPLLVGQGSLAVLRYGHLLHVGVIMALVKVYDFFKRLPQFEQEGVSTNQNVVKLSDQPNVIVIGDSMAVGIGCLDVFDKQKDSGIVGKIEHVELLPNETAGAPGPVFPQAVARVLSQRLGRPVSWRSAGVDGGDTTDIREHLLGVIQEEVDKGKAPDAVVVLTGANDLKRIISIFPNSKPCASIRGFRSNLLELVKDVQRISPNTKVVFPALPTYRLDSKSMMNVFPLSFFLDSLIGMWDSQKILAAQKSPSVFYYGLKPQEVNAWYEEERNKGESAPSLLSADGIHPNAKCYRKWGMAVGEKLADTLLEEVRKAEPAGDSATPVFLKLNNGLKQQRAAGILTI